MPIPPLSLSLTPSLSLLQIPSSTNLASSPNSTQLHPPLPPHHTTLPPPDHLHITRTPTTFLRAILMPITHKRVDIRRHGNDDSEQDFQTTIAQRVWPRWMREFLPWMMRRMLMAMSNRPMLKRERRRRCLVKLS